MDSKYNFNHSTYLNLGCGSRFHPDWVNIDIRSTNPNVQVYDLRNGIPYPDRTFEVVYHSHILEHFPKQESLSFLQECNRVLNPGGVIRVVVPDLEQITRMYLHALDEVLRNQNGWQDNYDWIMLELYDQTVRNYPGGAMGKYLSQNTINNIDFVVNRIGAEARIFIKSQEGKINTNGHKKVDIIETLNRIFRSTKEKMTMKFLGREDYQSLRIGRFRRSGEVHEWMYDRYSLATVLVKSGFHTPVQMDAYHSSIENWQDFYLDSDPDGSVNKPDSLFMEATKPY